METTTMTTTMITDVDYDQELADLFGGEPPGWVTEARKNFIRLTVSDWEGSRPLKVTVKDVVRYYAGDARNISSGCRTLAGHTGDWWPIDELAQICLNWFKRVNRKGLERASKPYGMTLRS